ncbi:MAG: phosphoribosylformylglycinamidine cyclo-ligase [Planctomycetes bacterium RBG_16_59_8]|nr:MAG: phosphoribosylformylglycinamidine cyclo-ligase [Planctomycetes bacterium RBG_16_59_8]
MGKPVTYVDAGVDTVKKGKFLENAVRTMRQTYDPSVIDLPKGFAGLYAIGGSRLFARKERNPVLAACTDGVGTKLKIAFMMNKHDTVGIDLVAMSVNDLIVTGASPLFFLDYISMGKLDYEIVGELLKGIIAGCRMAGCALLGGETAEMPGFYPKGEYDMAGFAVGIVDRPAVITGKNIRIGDDVIAVASSGLHSNGFSLVRKVLFESNNFSLDHKPEIFGGTTLGEEVLKPTRIYAKPLLSLLRRYKLKKVIKGIANITGGGLHENVPRILPRDRAIEIVEGSWDVPPIFRFLREAGPVPAEEMYHVFNMGIGLVLVVDPFFSAAIVRHLRKSGEKAFIVGKVQKGRREVRISSVK